MILPILLSLLTLVWQHAYPQTVTRGVLTITGVIEEPVTLTASELAVLPQHTVSVRDHAGKPVTFSGVTVQRVLERAGLQFGQRLRDARLTTCMFVEATDGYRVVFALPELDASFSDKIVLLAITNNGKQLASREGPFRIIVPDEKHEARWVRQVTALKILRAEDALEE